MLPRLCVCLCKCVQVCASACVCVAPWRHQSKDGPSSVTSSFTEAPPLPSLSLSVSDSVLWRHQRTGCCRDEWYYFIWFQISFCLFLFFFLCDFGLEIFFESWFFFYLSFSPFHIFHLPLAASAVDWVSPFAAARRCRSPTGTAWNSSCYYYYCQFSLHLNLSEWNSIPSWKERERERENLN